MIGKVISITCKVDGEQHEAYLFDADVPLELAKAFYYTTTLGASFENMTTTNMGSCDENIILDEYRKLMGAFIHNSFGIRF